MTTEIQIIRYNAGKREEWDTFVRTSRNGTFLFERDYMDYHASRFCDCSLMIYRKESLIGLLPANWIEGERTLYSHQGLTYGGLVMSEELTSIRILDIFTEIINWIKANMGATKWIYKPIPYIYSQCPSQEDLYTLFRHEAKLQTRAIASVIDMTHRIPLRKGRKSSIKQSLTKGVTVCGSDDIRNFWQILKQVLRDKHNATPVHSIEEMELLKSRFPENIRLYTVLSKKNEMLGGTIVYEMKDLIHIQYIAASNQGKEIGAIDALFAWLIDERYSHKRYIDFGTSVEQGGRVLNEGLIRQKEAFGARGIVYDSYVMEL